MCRKQILLCCALTSYGSINTNANIPQPIHIMHEITKQLCLTDAQEKKQELVDILKKQLLDNLENFFSLKKDAETQSIIDALITDNPKLMINQLKNKKVIFVGDFELPVIASIFGKVEIVKACNKYDHAIDAALKPLMHILYRAISGNGMMSSTFVYISRILIEPKLPTGFAFDDFAQFLKGYEILKEAFVDLKPEANDHQAPNACSMLLDLARINEKTASGFAFDAYILLKKYARNKI